MAPAASANGIPAAAFLPQGISVIGREGTIKWYEYGLSRVMPPEWSPFNDSVSGNQLSVRVSDADGQVIFIGTSKKRPDGNESRTIIEAPALTKRSQGKVTRQ
jgi:hypothetical protein